VYRIDTNLQLPFHEFALPFEGKLDPNNRWVRLSDVVPWDVIEFEYKQNFTETTGAPAINSRIAFGALLIKEKCGYTDRETVLQISENPYLQYFLGLPEFKLVAPFDHTMMVYFRKRFSLDSLSKINELIIPNMESSEEEPTSPNKGKLLLDATCTPADIRYPTDMSLLAEARKKTEEMIDILYEQVRNLSPKSKFRTYRQRAHKLFLGFIKKKRHSRQELRKATRQQLQFIRRNLKHIEKLLQIGASLREFSKWQYRDLLVIHELFRQQFEMYKTKSHRIAGRIVSIFQPHVRPIVRGKAAAKVEFGAKISFSVVNGFTRLEKLSWENYNEGIDLIETIERYKSREGFYPESVHVDQIYLNRENRKFCKEHNIRRSGKALGRPKSDTEQAKEERKRYIQDLRDRIPVEGKFGESKRRYGLSRVMAKLPDTSATVIALTVIIMNLEKALYFLLFLCLGSFRRQNCRIFRPV
jgi:hypothetical protein